MKCFRADSDDIIVHLRCVDLNARTLWTRQLQAAIDYARSSVPPSHVLLPAVVSGSGGGRKEASTAAIGRFGERSSLSRRLKGFVLEICRLLLELVAVRHLTIPADTPYACVQCRLQLYTQQQLHTITLPQTTSTTSTPNTQQQASATSSLCTTQFTLPRSTSNNDGAGESVQVDVLLHRDYSPDVLAGRAKVTMRDMMTASGAHRGPIVRQVRQGRFWNSYLRFSVGNYEFERSSICITIFSIIFDQFLFQLQVPLIDSQLPPSAGQSPFVIIKFFVQLFENI